MREIHQVHAHSGKLGYGPVVLPIVGLASGLFLAFVYAYITVHIPIAGYLSFLFVLGLGFGVGWSLSIGAKRAHCRSVGFLALTGLGTGLFTLYASWVFFEFAMLNQAELGIPFSELPSMFADPGLIWNIASGIAEDGWYSVAGMTPSGWVLWLLWLVEAVIIVGLVTLLPLGALTGEVYCERCRQWAAHGRKKRLRVIDDEEHLGRALAGNIEALATLPTAVRNEWPQLVIESVSCGRCKHTRAFRVSVASVDGDNKESSEDATEMILTSDESLSRLLSNVGRQGHSKS